MALSKVTMMTVVPLPINANSGPGQAPVIAQPNPNNNPPYTWPFENLIL